MSSLHALSPHRLEPPPVLDRADAWCLFLDVDGTLVPFESDPDMVQVPPALQTTLRRLHAALGGALALVSGRRLYDLDRLFGPPLVAAAGMHGLQRRQADGNEHNVLPAASTIHAMHRLTTALAQQLPLLRLEDKGACVALHYREAPAQAMAIEAGARRILEHLPGYELQPGNQVIELKPAGMDKGQAVRAFLDEAPFRGRLPIYLGDDLTDEHGFAASNAAGGLSIRVGRREPTQARHTLRDPGAVAQWLGASLAHMPQLAPG